MTNFFAELKRRHVYRVAAAYAVVAWIVLQIVNNVAPAFNLPGSAVMLVIVLLAAGFPIALIFAWVLELKSPTAPSKTSAMDWVLAVVAVAFFGMFAYQQIASSETRPTAQTGVEAARETAAKPAGISVAVLPFVNLSSDKEQEFFSDGMTEEITSALAKIPNLRVVGRTSAFQFKGENKDLRAIGQALSATHLIEGSVRKAGDRVRITAQLIRSDDGTHLWTENYDRQLTDIFAAQEDIAQAIASALQIPLGLKQGDTLVRNRTKDPETYDQYLRARALIRAPTMTSVTDAAKLLEQAVARDPDFAPAQAQLSLTYSYFAAFHPAVLSHAIEQARPIIESSLTKAEMAAQRAVQLDAKSSDAYVTLAFAQEVRGKFLAAGDLYGRALALDGDNPEALNFYSMMLTGLGYVKQALPIRQRLQTLEPFAPYFTKLSASILWIDGQTDEPIAMLKRVPEGFAAIRLAEIYAAQGRYGEAADLLLTRSDTYLPGTMEAAVRLLRTAPAVAASPQTLPRLGKYLEFVYLAVGAPGRVFDSLDDSLKLNFLEPTYAAPLWARPYAAIRKTQRFKNFVRNAGMVDYWRARGWPELCRPVGADDFVCD